MNIHKAGKRKQESGSEVTELKVASSTLRPIKETKKLVSDVKLNETHFTIHPFSQKLKWNDLARGDRVDGSSTGCYVLKMAPYNQFIESHMMWLADEKAQACGEEFTSCLQLVYSGVKSTIIK